VIKAQAAREWLLIHVRVQQFSRPDDGPILAFDTPAIGVMVPTGIRV
jgi:hypothetical protein